MRQAGLQGIYRRKGHRNLADQTVHVVKAILLPEG
jgi:hypothetical protein